MMKSRKRSSYDTVVSLERSTVRYELCILLNIIPYRLVYANRTVDCENGTGRSTSTSTRYRYGTGMRLRLDTNLIDAFDTEVVVAVAVAVAHVGLCHLYARV